MRRPDKGGTNAVRSVSLRANHFPVKFKSDRLIMHYDVDIKPEAPPKKGRAVKISKSTLYMIREKLCVDHPSQFPASKIAYDGEKNIFSAVELPTGKFKVEISGGEEMKVCSFIVTITLVKQLELQKLSDYLSGVLSFVPRDILQGMDVVMKENPARHMISSGRGFYQFKDSGKDELGYGIIASRGFQHSLKPTAQGLSLCLDYSVVPFFNPISVLEFLKEHVRDFSLREFKRYRSDVEATLKGLKVGVTHRNTGQKFIVAGLTSEDTRNLSFLPEDPEGNVLPKKVMLVDYFYEKYGKDIENQDIPCLDVGKNNRKNYVPMEFCMLVEGQRYTKEILDKEAAKRLKHEQLPTPVVRESKICEMMQANYGPCGGGIIDSFGIGVDKNMTEVAGRVIEPPELKLGGKLNKMTVERDRCQWNLVGKMVVKGIPVDHWAVVDFSGQEQYNRQNTNQFISRFIRRCEKLGIQTKDPLFCETASMHAFRVFPVLRELLNKVYKKARCKLQILVCVMARKDAGYGYLKWFAETKLGMVTQCCLSRPANKVSDHHLANLALKLNAKLGGSNVELIERLPRFEGEGHVMFIGADVNYPGSQNTTSPSIAAVVATVNWPAANRYAARIRPQAHRMEKIQNFGAMCLELVEAYVQANKVKPEKIVVFRDGVSEGQFDMVLNEELLDLKRAIQGGNYCPTITLIVARKRHLTRLFPKVNDRSFNGNVPPGTVVDTTVVHLSEFDFYLCSHYGTLGTSKPTHYHVLHDEHRFSSDQIQKLIYNLCFTFARCTKPVSLVPPVYYADLAAYRGRLYYDAIVAEVGASAATSSSSSAGAWLNDGLYRLHGALENMMFFI
ncbi:protein argonaute 2-like [Vitis riparia]|uniref:protein argonaute 2-like n=1 Tax=Vitis riparia TaxID=96939 RepID=UPI00155AE4C7|nr:protein argonaute 2-like [Vitis riparia]